MGEGILWITSILIMLAIALFLIFSNKEVPMVSKVIMPKEFVDFLNKKFESSNNEFAFCLKGKVENQVFQVLEIAEPKSSTPIGEDSIIAKCPIGTIATIHNHPNKLCKLSSLDLYTFGKSKHPTLGVICGANNIAFYNPSSLDNSISVELGAK